MFDSGFLAFGYFYFGGSMDSEVKLSNGTYVVFDLETTGLKANEGDSIIEIGAVKISNGQIIDRFDELIDPGVKLDEKITEITCITDEMLKGRPKEKEIVIKFMEWCGDVPMVAHNARFDLSFLEFFEAPEIYR